MLQKIGAISLESLNDFFPQIDKKRTFEFDGINHFLVGQGGNRIVFADPNLDYVLKVPKEVFYGQNGHFLGRLDNAYEYYRWCENLAEFTTPKPYVKTELVDVKNTIIKQSFVIPIITSRGCLNPFFEPFFTPEKSKLTLYGYQYGWNKKTKQFEVYDFADELLQSCNYTDGKYINEDGIFIDLDFVRKFSFRRKFIHFLRYQHNDLLTALMQFTNDRPLAKLEHHQGVFFDHKNGIIRFQKMDDMPFIERLKRVTIFFLKNVVLD